MSDILGEIQKCEYKIKYTSSYLMPLQVCHHMLIFHDDPGEFDDKALRILQQSSYVRKINENGYAMMGETSCHPIGILE